MLCEEIFFELFCGGGLSGISGIFWNHPDQPHSSFPLTIWDHLELIWNHCNDHLESSGIPDETSLPPSSVDTVQHRCNFREIAF